MKTLEQFFPFLMPMVPGCAETMAEFALRQATRQFCQMTRAWRVQMDPIVTSEGVREYDLPLDRNTELVRIEAAKLVDRPIVVATEKQSATECRNTVGCFDGKTVVLTPPPADGQVLALLCAIKPGQGASSLEDFLYDLYAEDIALGAGAYLKNLPQKPFTDASQAAADKEAFELRCARIKVRLWRGNSRNSPRVVPVWK